MPWASFISRNIAIAEQLNAGGCGAGYAEATAHLANFISGIAADLWPGLKIDQCRFVELWSRSSDPTLGTTKISIPLLVQSLNESQDFASAEKLIVSRPKMFGPGYDVNILTGEEVDLSESDVLAILPKMKLRDIRFFSYGALFYKHVRSGLAHEFHLTECATAHPMTRRQEASISYSNQFYWVEDLSGERTYQEVRRPIHFHFWWLVEVTRSIASKFDSSTGPLEVGKPPKWWIDGG